MTGAKVADASDGFRLSWSGIESGYKAINQNSCSNGMSSLHHMLVPASTCLAISPYSASKMRFLRAQTELSRISGCPSAAARTSFFSLDKVRVITPSDPRLVSIGEVLFSRMKVADFDQKGPLDAVKGSNRHISGAAELPSLGWRDR